MSSTISFRLDQSKILLSGNELTLYYMTNLLTGPNSKHFQTTYQNVAQNADFYL